MHGGSMRFIKLILLIPSICYGLDEFVTKQAINKIRYISKDGKVTYYQKNSGELQLSTNYKFANIVKGKKRTQYLVHASTHKQKIVIETDESYFNQVNFLKDNRISVANYGVKSELLELGQGTNPILHLQDQWVSFYRKETKQLVFKSFNSNIQEKSISLINKSNPFFTPQHIMLTPNDVLYTDINKAGHMAILLYSFTEKSFKTIYKTKDPGNKIDLCQIGNQLIIGEFPVGEIQSSSSIMAMNIFNNKDFKKVTPLYSSELPDIGNMKCVDNLVFFAKTMGTDQFLNVKRTEIAKLDITTSKLEILTSEKYINQIIRVGEMILTSLKGKYFILYGKNNLITDEIKKDNDK
jgi:hypothetical protein